jgi:hypothetical protein
MNQLYQFLVVVVVIDNAKYGDVLHVSGIGPNLLSIYRIRHTNKKMEF